MLLSCDGGETKSTPSPTDLDCTVRLDWSLTIKIKTFWVLFYSTTTLCTDHVYFLRLPLLSQTNNWTCIIDTSLYRFIVLIHLNMIFVLICLLMISSGDNLRTRPTYFPPRTTTKSTSTTPEVPMTIKIEGIPKKSCCTKEGFKLDWTAAIRPLG